MKLFLDTNVLLDYAVNQNDNHEIIQSVIKSCIERKNEGFITSHSITDFFYIARNYFTNKDFEFAKVPVISGREFLMMR